MVVEMVESLQDRLVAIMDRKVAELEETVGDNMVVEMVEFHRDQLVVMVAGNMVAELGAMVAGNMVAELGVQGGKMAMKLLVADKLEVTG